jgi:hypothetical protein
MDCWVTDQSFGPTVIMRVNITVRTCNSGYLIILNLTQLFPYVSDYVKEVNCWIGYWLGTYRVNTEIIFNN